MFTSQSIAQLAGTFALAIGLLLVGYGAQGLIRFMLKPPCPDYSPERPTVPETFRPAKQNPPRRPRPVSDRLVRQVRMHAREVHALDQEGPRA